MSFLESFIMKKMDKNTKRLERVVMYPHRNVELLTLQLGDTSVQREIFADGSRGNIRICTQEAQDFIASYVSYTRYEIANGKLVSDPFYHQDQDDDSNAPFGRRFLLVMKLLLSFSEAPYLDYEEDDEVYAPVA